MERYKLEELYTIANFATTLATSVNNMHLMDYDKTSDVSMSFIAYAIYNEFYEDIVNYEGEDDDEVKTKFMKRLGYDVAVKFPYWRTKYAYIKKLFTESEINLLQSSRMISSSKERVDNAGGVLQKTASTPTGVSTNPVKDEIDIKTTTGETAGGIQTNDTEVETTGFVDKYTNYQGKTTTSSKTSGERSGDVLREGSIEDLIKVLEKLPASFADEITKEVAHHFEFVYSY